MTPRAWGLLFTAVVCVAACGGDSDGTAATGGMGGSGGSSTSGGAAGAGGEAGGSGGFGAGPTITTEFGAPSYLATGLNYPLPLAVDAQHVYFAEYGSVVDEPDGLKRVAKNGGSPETIDMDQLVTDVAVDDSHVYWSGLVEIKRATKADMSAIEVLSNDEAEGVALGGEFLFYTYFDELHAVRKLDGVGTTIATGLGTDGVWGGRPVTADSERVYVSFWDTSPPAGSYISVVIDSWPHDGGSATRITEGVSDKMLPKSDGAFLYGIVNDVAYRVPVSGGQREGLAPVSETASDIAVDELNVYVVERGGVAGEYDCTGTTGRVVALPKNGGSVSVIADGLRCPRHLAVDAEGVYWTETGDWDVAGTGSVGAVSKL